MPFTPMDNLEYTAELSMALTCGKKPDHLEESHTGKGEAHSTQSTKELKPEPSCCEAEGNQYITMLLVILVMFQNVVSCGN